MNESKLPHAIISAAISLTGSVAWLVAHAGTIVLILSGIAAVYSMRATQITIQVKKLERERLKRIDTEIGI